MLSVCEVIHYCICFCIVIFPIRCVHDVLKSSRAAISKFFSFFSNCYCSNYLTIFFNFNKFLFWQKCSYFKFNIRFFWWPASYSHSFLRNYFRSDHVFMTVDTDEFTSLIIFSILFAFTLKSVAKVLVRT